MDSAAQHQMQEILAKGVRYGQEGQFSKAVEAFRKLLALHPASAEAWFNLGVALRGMKQLPAAIEAFENAAKHQSKAPEVFFNLGNCYRDAKDRQAAIRAFERALTLQPDYTKAINNLANLYFEQGQLSQAAGLWERALKINPAYAEAHFNLGKLLRRQRRTGAALEATAKAVSLHPNNHKYRLKLAELQRVKGQFHSARESLEHILCGDPNHLSALMQLVILLRDQNLDEAALERLNQTINNGNVNADVFWHRADLHRLAGRLEEAVVDLHEALKLAPKMPMAHNLLGVCRFAQGQAEQALESYDRALALQADLAEAHCNRGAALQVLRRFREGNVALDAAIRLKPDFAVARLNRALCHLRDEDFIEGWREFEWRFLCQDYKLSFHNRPTWNGESLHGKSILLRSEQGLGDTLQFIRYARLLKERGARVVVECQAPVLELAASSPGVDEVVSRGAPLPHVDLQVPLMSLPTVFGTTLATVPSKVPYVHPDPQRVQAWRERLKPLGELIVAISWQGNKKFQADRYRSLALRNFQALAQIPGVALVSLQKNAGTEQLQEDLGFHVHAFTEELDASGPFRDTAAIMAAADMMVTSDTAVAHLAGALGIPVWVALSYSADWRWLASGDTSPWYPTMRLFRQPHFGDWPAVFQSIAQELALVRQGDRTRMLPQARNTALTKLQAEISPGELLDKITILEIKSERFTDSQKLRHVRLELATLQSTQVTLIAPTPSLQELVSQLRNVNQRLWDIEDEIRDCEHRQDFGARFVELARSVYKQNDRRAAIKRAINDLLGSTLVEEKGYSSNYQAH